MTAPFIVYGNRNSSPATRVVLLLTMAGQPFLYRHVDLAAKQQKSQDYLAMYRFGRVPVLVHGDLTLGESSVILPYLAEVTGQFGGRDAKEKLHMAEWVAWLGDVVLPVQRLRAIHIFSGDQAAIPWVRQHATNGLKLVGDQLADGRPFLTGDRLTIADIFLFPWIDVAEDGKLDIGDHPTVKAWYDRMLTQPRVKRQYDLMPTADVPA